MQLINLKQILENILDEATSKEQDSIKGVITMLNQNQNLPLPTMQGILKIVKKYRPDFKL